MSVEFCTICDEGFLIKALVLDRSLLRHSPAFRLTVFCLDERSQRILDRLELPHLQTVPMAELEAFDPELAAVKPDRNVSEYSWTAKSSMIKYLFASLPEGATVSYMDADQMFFSDPEALFEEMGDASVMITPHRFSREHEEAVSAGIYNAGFITFRNDRRGNTALEWWRERCLEWCFHRHEPDRSGDQKYLDDWTERFEGVHVLADVGGGLAPWNLGDHRIRKAGAGVLIDGRPLIFFHYHRVELRLAGKHGSRPAGYHIPRRAMRLIYEPYLAEIDAAWDSVRAIDPAFSAGLAPKPSGRDRVSKRLDEARLMLLAHAGPLRRLKRQLQ